MDRIARTILLGAAATLVACGGGESTTAESEGAPSAAQPAAGYGDEQTPDAGREVVVVEMLTDDQGNNIFRPADFEVHPGDVVRFTLVSGVHNAHFVADSNRSVSGLPPASPLLQLPGQTWDYKVSLPPGRYYYQCDPHALLGMIGHMEVEEEN
jgi:plastocyanin